MKYIGITGKARSGKDTFADILCEEYDFAKVALARPIKEACSLIFGIPEENFYLDDKKEETDEYWKMSPREIAQIFGTEAMRNAFGDDIWLRVAEQHIRQSISSLPEGHIKGIVISDIRFENEAKWMRGEMNGQIVHIHRCSLGDGVVRGHVSEMGVRWENGDLGLHNDGSLEGYKEQIRRMCDEII